MQTIHAPSTSTPMLELPDCNVEVVPGVMWGSVCAVFTPAYWASQMWFRAQQAQGPSYKLGNTLAEESAACLLGGHGVTGEMGVAAYYHLRDSGLLAKNPVSSSELEQALLSPLTISGRSMHYRYPHQKASYLAPLLNAIHELECPSSDAAVLRDWLLQFDGVGLKTASWIVRNWLDSDEVAILDIHVYRAGLVMGLFTAQDDVRRDYPRMEARFVSLARAMGVRAAQLDAQIWSEVRQSPRLVRQLLPQ